MRQIALGHVESSKLTAAPISRVNRSNPVVRAWPFKGRPPVGGCIDGHRDSTGREIQIGDVVEFIDGGQTVVMEFCGPEGFVGDSGAVYWCCVVAVQATAAPLAGKRSAAGGAADELSSIPHGNHGDNTSQVTE